MNPVYQLLPSICEVLGAVLFVILVKRMRFTTQKITIKPVQATGKERIPTISPDCSAEDEITKFLVISGLKVRSGASVKDTASEHGIIYHSNLGSLRELLQSKPSKITVFNKSIGAIGRQIMAPNPISGTLLSYLVDKNIQIL